MIIKNGNEAVNFFFFLSGFVMVVSNRKFFEDKASVFNKKEFFTKRFARIYPLYLLAIVLLLVFHFGVKKIDTDTVLYRMPFEVAGVQRWLYGGSFNYPGWSISCEFMFYLLFPFLAIYLRKHRQRFTIFAWGYFIKSLLVTLFLSNYLKSPHPQVLVKLAGMFYLNPVLLISIFILGILTGKCFLENKISLFHYTWFNVSVILLSVGIITVAKYYAPNGSGLLKGGLLAPVYFIFLMAVSSFNKVNTAVFSSKPVIFLGEISYGIYILQYPFYVFYTHYLTKIQTWTDLFLFTSALITFAGLLHIAFERPLRNAIIKLVINKVHITRA